MNQQQAFPAGSIRAAVATLGDSWAVQYLDADWNCEPISAESRDQFRMRRCSAAVFRAGRAASMSFRAGVQS